MSAFLLIFGWSVMLVAALWFLGIGWWFTYIGIVFSNDRTATMAGAFFLTLGGLIAGVVYVTAPFSISWNP